MRTPAALDAATDRLEQADGLDAPAAAVKKVVDAALSRAGVRDALNGVWLGHPLHPMLIIAPLGGWLSAAVLDLLPGDRGAARTLVGLGTLAAVPAAVTGWADWSQLHPQQQRVGLVHAAGNGVAAALQVASYRARRRGAHARGARLSLAALAAGGVAGWLGGHLAYRQSAGANHAEQAPHVLPEEFTRLCALDELPDGRPVRRVLDANPVFVLRRGDRVDALFDQCAHLSGPLSEGELSGAGDELCVSCPWHGSVFRVADGRVVRGPSTHPAPVLQVRVEPDGTVLARLPE
jgi:nitrite reductase/ring-hydroxylating ferredoxin subunit